MKPLYSSTLLNQTHITGIDDFAESLKDSAKPKKHSAISTGVVVFTYYYSLTTGVTNIQV